MKVKVRASKGGKGAVTTRCEYCGEPISATSREFGMDCANHCAEKRFVAERGADGCIVGPAGIDAFMRRIAGEVGEKLNRVAEEGDEVVAK